MSPILRHGLNLSSSVTRCSLRQVESLQSHSLARMTTSTKKDWRQARIFPHLLAQKARAVCHTPTFAYFSHYCSFAFRHSFIHSLTSYHLFRLFNLSWTVVSPHNPLSFPGPTVYPAFHGADSLKTAFLAPQSTKRLGLPKRDCHSSMLSFIIRSH